MSLVCVCCVVAAAAMESEQRDVHVADSFPYGTTELFSVTDAVLVVILIRNRSVAEFLVVQFVQSSILKRNPFIKITSSMHGIR